MNRIRDRIIAWSIVVAIAVTLYPPHTIIEYLSYREEPSIKTEYRFIGDGGKWDDQTSIAFDRLLLQYAMIAGAGFAIFLLKRKGEE